MPCATYTNPNLQNAYWKGFNQANEVTNLIVWNFHGECIYVDVNFPLSWHDSKLAANSGLYSFALIEYIPAGFAVLAGRTIPRTVETLKSKIV